MKRVEIIKNGQMIYRHDAEDVQPWLDFNLARKTFGEPGEYEITPPRDITQELEQLKANHEAEAYLRETDWLIIRELETGVKAPPEVKALRAQARVKVKK